MLMLIIDLTMELTVIGHSLGGSVALGLEKQYKQEGNNPKTFGAPVISSNCSGTNPNRISWAGDPISALGFNSTTGMQPFKQRFNNSDHSYSGLFIKDAVPIHDAIRNNLTPSPDDREAEVITH